MNTPSVGVERRIGQRFTFNLPVSLREVSSAATGLGFTQNLSSRGVFLFTEMPASEDAEVELTLKMPSEITLGESMRVRCRGRVLRVVRTEKKSISGNERDTIEAKIGVAVCFSSYEYLPEVEDGSADFRRVSVLHNPIQTKPDPAILP